MMVNLSFEKLGDDAGVTLGIGSKLGSVPVAVADTVAFGGFWASREDDRTAEMDAGPTMPWSLQG